VQGCWIYGERERKRKREAEREKGRERERTRDGARRVAFVAQTKCVLWKSGYVRGKEVGDQ
jgi:hypothetical protein